MPNRVDKLGDDEYAIVVTRKELEALTPELMYGITWADVHERTLSRAPQAAPVLGQFRFSSLYRACKNAVAQYGLTDYEDLVPGPPISDLATVLKSVPNAAHARGGDET